MKNELIMYAHILVIYHEEKSFEKSKNQTWNHKKLAVCILILFFVSTKDKN